MENTELFYTLTAIFYNFANLILIAAGVILFSKKQSFYTIIVLIGSILILFGSLFHAYLNFSVLPDDMDQFMQLNIVASIFSSGAYFIFCIGLFLFAISDFKKLKAKNEFIDK